ncbi:MAG: ATP--guanido phosphotransferase [Spirochaetota bacterium]
MFDHLLEKPGFWSRSGPYPDVVLSTRVRLARNLATLPFPGNMGSAETDFLNGMVDRLMQHAEFSGKMSIIRMDQLSLEDKRFLRERNIITRELELSDKSSVMMADDEEFMVLVNEEDHLRIQVIKPGFQLTEAYMLANVIDDEINRHISYAYRDDFGYLTACPSNAGTGMRVSTIVHLPMLSLMKNISEVIKMVKEAGGQMKGTMIQGSRTVGNMFILSNRITLGVSEVDIIEEMDRITNMVMDLENEARDDYGVEHRTELEDAIWRSLGILKFARSISFVEAMENLSLVRLGVILSVIKNIDLWKINDLMVTIQMSHLQKLVSVEFASVEECDIFRAAFLREQLE